MAPASVATRDSCPEPRNDCKSDNELPDESEAADTIYLQWLLSWDDSTPDSQDGSDTISRRPRIRLHYSDEGVRDRFCANAQRLLVLAMDDPRSVFKNTELARKALGYRNLMSCLDGVDPRASNFDVSSFFGVEWHKQQPENE
ncbi:uncharacterized protein IUM83_18633 [Phytophthora cinnamomi]|uniref:uncharacterized protein n=1 Tax=Phytophthora cinnamomi TaxID=4785 RepID=UPI00355A45E4|nr:hypothetical protein IUM83_18633 [Phytophthora cinnamomi]